MGVALVIIPRLLPPWGLGFGLILHLHCEYHAHVKHSVTNICVSALQIKFTKYGSA